MSLKRSRAKLQKAQQEKLSPGEVKPVFSISTSGKKQVL
jgi:hypothetical protein